MKNVLAMTMIMTNKPLVELKEDYCNDVIECSNETKSILEKDISYLLDNYRFDEEMLKEGQDLYRYEEFMKIEKDAKFIRENALYDWSLFKDEYSYRKNYIDKIEFLTERSKNI